VGFLGGDVRVLEAHARAVKSALREFEAFASTRIRTDGSQNDRRTGNFAAALFTHDTSRALDPHLHTHCIVFNANTTISVNKTSVGFHARTRVSDRSWTRST
jgi:conjugative relaxase-like TrwC/TraI family protein